MRDNNLLKIVIAIAFVVTGIILGVIGYDEITSGYETSHKIQRLILWVGACLLWGRFLRTAIRRYTKEMRE